MKKIRVLVVDDDAVLRRVVSEQIGRAGFDARAAASGEEALRVLAEADYDVVLLDIRMPGLSGLEALREIRKLEDPPEVVMLTADTSLGAGLEAMRHGAYDYLTKPSTLDEIEAVARKAEEKRRLVRQSAAPRDQPQRASDEAPAFVHSSRQMSELVALAETAARSDSTVILTGESGTGKDVIARFIHARSSRSANPIVSINCAALPEALFESEFFGHEKGAFTGASATKHGLIEAADSSTLFLDEVGEMPHAAQAKLLHFLEEGRYRRVGSTRDRSSDARVIAATNRRLAEDVAEGRFRADLFYRLNVISLHVPPLRERRDDIPTLVEHFLARNRERFGRPALALAEGAMRRLEEHDWPGNVRELRNAIERAAALADGDTIPAEQIINGAAQGGAPAGPRPETSTSSTGGVGPTPTLEELERKHILNVVRDVGGNRERAAVVLGISARTLYRKLREYEAADSAAKITPAEA
jgi:DNA-binding NtrC family response regulator